ncbi:ferredoxin [Pedobacter sp. BS3]|uniref:ferredoxin n=1 Tax=Pedobacter sp. BS3 TaxID=2567937 RepID=UPI0011EFC7AF|nr:ferredoxin [Pedobacter sp. BS3]TZF82636.1 ferredoxin [Pedobacter sp. BS3]
MPKIIHYRKKCIGCGICVELQPELWRMSKKDGKATLLQSVARKDLFVLPVRDEQFQNSIKVAEACPVKVIQVR